MDDTKKIAALISDVRVKINGFLIQELQSRGITGLAPSHGGILHQLFLHHAVAMKELAKAVRRDKSTVTTLVGKLVSAGYVEKVTCADDQRSSIVRLTKKGEGLRPAFEEISEQLLARTWRGFEPGEQQELVRLLKKMAGNF